MSGTMPGPDFWSAVYGLDSLEEFTAEVRSFMPTFRLWGVGYDIEQVAQLAYWNSETFMGQLANAGLFAKKKLGLLDDDIRPHLADTANQSGGPPMPTLVIPGVIRIAIEGSSGGQPVVNVIGVRKGTGTVTTALEAVKAQITKTTGPLFNNASDRYYCEQLKATDLSTLDGAVAELAVGKTGGVVSHAATAGACALVKFSGGTRSRSANGRMYYGPIDEDSVDQDGRTLAATRRNGLLVDMNAFRDGLEAAGHKLCVVSAKTLSATDVTSISVDTLIATQRRRIR